MNFADNLKNIRHQQGMTQADVATELHVSRKTISSWENGRTYPDILTLVKLGDVYQISLDRLMKEDLGMAQHYQHQEKVSRWNDRVVELTIYSNIALLFLFYVLMFLPGHRLAGIAGVLLLINLIILAPAYQDFGAWRVHGWHLALITIMAIILNTVIVVTITGRPEVSMLASNAANGAVGAGYAFGYVVGRAIWIGTLTVSGIFAIYGRAKQV
ncbi:helix-turn-helix domain-containing protein [Levilactobacillus fujinensis]|uniref:Helix-turn-helix domain-containing protein n=1 Tax=Levilactobacillus fujinensis TaxID=2486024 RepID=A0ABW1TJC8_9LACO|nr:helix-turn-helix transcriptional regulator [Levilactobacillus fujinensis]